MTNNVGSTESTTGGQKYDTLPTTMPSLQEVLSAYFASEWRMDKNTTPIPEMVSDLLALLSQHGVVQLDENQSIPTIGFVQSGDAVSGYLLGQGGLLNANFKRVRPLVEEKNDT